MESRRIKKPIIVCDDDPDIRDILSVTLRHAGYDVLCAAGYTDLMYFMENVRPCLVLLDIRMPEWDGFYIAETFRKRGILVPIIFITAHDNRFSRVYAPALGAVGYFTKPLDMDELVQKIYVTLHESAPPAPQS
jgi:two-component system, OmpR family, response regulator